MRTDPCRRLRSILACLLLAAVPAAAHASDATMKILEFFDARATIRVAWESRLAEMRRSDPEFAGLVNAALSQADPEDLPRRLADLLDHFLEPDDIAAVSAFIQTPDGLMLAKIFKEQKTLPGLREAMLKIPPQDRARLDRVFEARPMTRVINAINSPEARDLGRRYGEEMGCKYALSRPEYADRVKLSGRCK